MTDLHLELNQSLDLRIAQFKNDPDRMREVNEFLNELFDKAQKEVARRNGKQKGKMVRIIIINTYIKIIKLYVNVLINIYIFSGCIRNTK